jgi:DNA-binding FadR family transcriptional regulator
LNGRFERKAGTDADSHAAHRLLSRECDPNDGVAKSARQKRALVNAIPSLALRVDKSTDEFIKSIDEFTKGYRGHSSTPACIAWTLEAEAVDRGWVPGEALGNESSLRKRYGLSRNAMREALRILEARGTIQIERGRGGGLRLSQPHLDDAAGTLAAFVRASNIAETEVQELTQLMGRLPGDIHPSSSVVCIYRRMCELLAGDHRATLNSRALGFVIANRLVRECAPIPEAGIELGSQQHLCDRFAVSLPIFRQALRILDDLAMLKVQRGRGGGCQLRRPSPIGVVRHLFVYFASRRESREHIMAVNSKLDFVTIQLAARRILTLQHSALCNECDRLSAVLKDVPEPHRWMQLQQALLQMAANPLLETLKWACRSYEERISPLPATAWRQIEDDLLKEEEGILAGFRKRSMLQMEHHQTRAHELIIEMLRRNMFERSASYTALQKTTNSSY